MANQKITDLSRLQTLAKSDLLVVVDTSANGITGSPTGETMAIEAGTLAGQLAEIQQGDVGISLPALSDVPNSYQGWSGGYLQINDSEDGVVFTDSPGAAELSIPVYDANGVSNFYISGDSTIDETYKVGNVLTRSNNKYQKATSVYRNENEEIEQEVVGIIRKIKREVPTDQNSTITHINVAFGGHIEFQNSDGTPTFPVSYSSSTNLVEPIPMLDGKTYFVSSDNILDADGLLSLNDPGQSFADAKSHVSKPLIVATSASTGVIVNYRGLVCESGDEPHKFVIEVVASCTNVKVGDIMRVKRKIQRNADNSFGSNLSSEFNEELEGIYPAYLDVVPEGEYTLSNARAVYGEVSEQDKAYYADVLGIVISANKDTFQIQTEGMVKFERPVGLDSANTDGAMFKQGYTYYLNAFDPQSLNTEFSKPRLQQTLYDYNTTQFSEAGKGNFADSDMKSIVNGERPFRNTTINNPFKRDATTGSVTAYQKPVFYAISDTQILLLNDSVYPSPIDQCNASNPILNSTTKCSSKEQTTHLTTTESPYTNTDGNNFLRSAFPSAQEDDIVIITHQGWELDVNTTTFVEKPKSYITERWYLASDTNTGSAIGNWNNISRTI